MPKSAYKRILLKLSGEALEGQRDGGIDFEAVSRLSDEIVEVRAMKVEVGLVVGGGNIFRGSNSIKNGPDKTTGDYMGMLATMINGQAFQSVLESKGVATRLMTALDMPPVAEPYIRRRAVRHLEKGRVVIFVGGTGNPYFTTDTAAALRANEVGAEILLKATRVDGVYDSDPLENPSAKRYDTLSFTTALTKNLGVMDGSAIALCRDNDLPIHVFDLTKPGNIVRAVRGEAIGTVVKGD